MEAMNSLRIWMYSAYSRVISLRFLLLYTHLKRIFLQEVRSLAKYRVAGISSFFIAYLALIVVVISMANHKKLFLANCKRSFRYCLFLSALHVLFMHHTYSMGRISESHAVIDNDWGADFRETWKLNGIWKKACTDSDEARVLIVAKDKGKGNYTTIQSAIEAVPKNNHILTCIRLQPGIYSEKVKISVDKPYIFLSGTDANNTVITWNDHARTNKETYFTPTVSVDASDFKAEHITFQNSYGRGSQAVALRVSGDRSAFYGCQFLGYQDTLFDDNGRHYFKDCFIEGAADFICGDGQSLYETCHLHAIPEGSGAITAQRRFSPPEQTGYSFVNCSVTGSGLLYLGRAWGPYSTVVFARTYFDNIIMPEGWENWRDSSRNKTVYYGEYQCYGPGANRTGRVPWSHNLTDVEAAPFLNISFIDGDTWL